MSAKVFVRGTLLGLLPLVLMGGYASSAEQQGGSVFYIATDGNDAWSGTLPEPNSGGTDGPFASLIAARDAIRLLQTNKHETGPVTVYFRGGTYKLSNTVVFTPEDSGTPQQPRIYKAYKGEAVTLSGGQELSGWRRVVGAGDLPQGGLGAPPRQDDLWMATLPQSNSAGWDFRELFINGQRRQRARTPNKGYFLGDGEITVENPARLPFHPGDIDPAWAIGGHTEVHSLLHWGGFNLLLRSVDTATHIATLSARRQPWGNDNKPRYWLENFPQALDAPGEWYLDCLHGVVYYHALPGEDMSRSIAVAPRLRQLIQLVGEAEGESEKSLVHNVSFEGLTFSYTDWANTTAGWVHSFTAWSQPEDGHIDEQGVIDVPAALEAVGTHMISIDKCTFTHLGGYAVEFHGGSREDRVTNSSMTDLGAGGVKIGDGKSPSFDAQGTSGNLISDNSIHDIGVVYPTGLGVWIGESSGNTVAHNEIYDTYYSGISIGWTWSYGPTWARDNIIEFNNIYNISRRTLSDLGCIYTVGVQPGTIIRNNVCHDVTRYEHGYGGWGIYTDEGSSNILIENNLVYRTVDGGFHQNYGRENVVRNNIFAFGEKAQLQRTHGEDHTSFTFEHNIFYWTDGKLLTGKWNDGHYKFDNNLYFQAGHGAPDFDGTSLADWRNRGMDLHSVVVSPMFKDPEQGDFSLGPDSPALKIGFKPFDTSSVGPRKGN